MQILIFLARSFHFPALLTPVKQLKHLISTKKTRNSNSLNFLVHISSPKNTKEWKKLSQKYPRINFPLITISLIKCYLILNKLEAMDIKNYY